MAGEPVITVVGNLTRDPELRFSPNGVAVTRFSVASTPRTFDAASREWKEGETLFMNCTAFKKLAENVAESLTKGTRVVVTGRLEQRSWEKDGEKHTAVGLVADEVGASLMWATVSVRKHARDGQGGGSGGDTNPWMTSTSSNSGGSPADSSPPF